MKIYKASNKIKLKLSLAIMCIEQKLGHYVYINLGISHNHNGANGLYGHFSIVRSPTHVIGAIYDNYRLLGSKTSLSKNVIIKLISLIFLCLYRIQC